MIFTANHEANAADDTIEIDWSHEVGTGEPAFATVAVGSTLRTRDLFHYGELPEGESAFISIKISVTVTGSAMVNGTFEVKLDALALGRDAMDELARWMIAGGFGRRTVDVPVRVTRTPGGVQVRLNLNRSTLIIELEQSDAELHGRHAVVAPLASVRYTFDGVGRTYPLASDQVLSGEQFLALAREHADEPPGI